MVYRPDKQHLNADAFSQVPLLETPPDFTVTTEHARRWTAEDVTLSHVHRYMLHGWTSGIGASFHALIHPYVWSLV